MPALKKENLKEKVRRLKGKSLTKEQFFVFSESLRDLGYYIVNGNNNKLNDYIGYKAFLIIDEWENDKGEKIIMEYIYEIINGIERIHIKEVEFIR